MSTAYSCLKARIQAQRPIKLELIPVFFNNEATRSISSPRPLDGMLLHRWVTPLPHSPPPPPLELNSLVPSYTPGLRETPWKQSVLPKNTIQFPGKGRTCLLGPEYGALKPLGHRASPNNWELKHRPFLSHGRQSEGICYCFQRIFNDPNEMESPRFSVCKLMLRTKSR